MRKDGKEEGRGEERKEEKKIKKKKSAQRTRQWDKKIPFLSISKKRWARTYGNLRCS